MNDPQVHNATIRDLIGEWAFYLLAKETGAKFDPSYLHELAKEWAGRLQFSLDTIFADQQAVKEAKERYYTSDDLVVCATQEDLCRLQDVMGRLSNQDNLDDLLENISEAIALDRVPFFSVLSRCMVAEMDREHIHEHIGDYYVSS